jgi:hypothetical protein
MIPTVVEGTKSLALNSAFEAMAQTRAAAHQELQRARERMQLRNQGRPVLFSIGEEVWLDGRNLPIPGHRKFSPHRYGPLRIRQRISNWAYKFELPAQWKVHPMFHVNLLSRYQQMEVHSAQQPWILPDLIEGSEEWEVEAILGHKQNK